MKKIFIPIISLLFLFSCRNSGGNHAEHNANSSPTANDTNRKSIPSETKKSIGSTDIKINYTAPAVRGRKIWGGLVPYDAVWVTGAHNATTLEVGSSFQVGDKVIPAGRYAIFTIPGQDEWTVIINKNWDQHLADEYSEKDDIQRVKVKPLQSEQIIERLKYEIDQTGERTADIIISWEKIKVPFHLEIRP